MDPTAFQQSLGELMSVFQQRMDSFEGKLQKSTTTATTESLASEFTTFKSFVLNAMKALQGQIECLAKQVDQLEMRSRRKILLFHGIPENPTEDAAEVVARSIVHKLKHNNFMVGDIARCHRMGRAGSSLKPRPILCKLRDLSVRDKIWSSKTSLKGSGVTISEFLTKNRHNVFMAAREQFGVAKCWTREGVVFVVDHDGTRHRLSCQRDLEAISQKVVAPKPPAPAKDTVAQTKTKRVNRK